MNNQDLSMCMAEGNLNPSALLPEAKMERGRLLG